MLHRFTRAVISCVALSLTSSPPASAQPQASGKAAAASSLGVDIDRLASAVEPELLAWRRHLHQNPELSNREVETAKYRRRAAQELRPRAADRDRQDRASLRC